MILVTGGGGFIGRQVCQLLAASGQEALAVDLHFPSLPACQTIQGDISRPDFLPSLFRSYSFDAIVHLASVLNTASRERPEQAMQVNIGGSLTLLDLAMQNKVTRFIYGSSISAYGFKPYADYGAVSEDEPAAPDHVYGISKRFVEIVGEQYRRQAKIEFIALRIAMVVGVGAANTASPWRSEIFDGVRATQRRLIRMPFEPHERLPLIHVAEVAACIQRLLTARSPLYSIYNTPSENWECGDLAAAIQALNAQVDIQFSPSHDRGDPEAIAGSRFVEEFDFHPGPIRARLRRAIEEREG